MTRLGCGSFAEMNYVDLLVDKGICYGQRLFSFKGLKQMDGQLKRMPERTLYHTL